MKWWLLCLSVLALILLRNQPWDCLIGYDQAKQAYVSLEMVQDGHWWHQHLPTGLPQPNLHWPAGYLPLFILF